MLSFDDARRASGLRIFRTFTRLGSAIRSAAPVRGDLSRCLLAAALLLALATDLRSEQPRAQTSRSAREVAASEIPLDQLDARARERVASVLSRVSVFRRLPTQAIECDPDLYLFLVDHPDLVVNVWEVLKISDMRMNRKPDGSYDADDGAGTLGKVEYLYRSHDLHILYAEGSYEGPLFVRPVRGRCLLVLRSGYHRETNGKYYVSCRLDSFVQLDQVGVEFVARTFQPLVGKVADHNFRETAIFLSVLSRAAEVNRPGIEDLAPKLARVSEADRAEFLELAHRVGERAKADRADTAVRQEAMTARQTQAIE